MSEGQFSSAVCFYFYCGRKRVYFLFWRGELIGPLCCVCPATFLLTQQNPHNAPATIYAGKNPVSVPINQDVCLLPLVVFNASNTQVITAMILMINAQQKQCLAALFGCFVQ